MRILALPWLCRCARGRRATAALLTLAALASGCTQDLPPLQPAPAIIQATWNPATGVLPTPTDLVRDGERGLLSLPIDGAMSEAEQEFRRYLNSLDGYPVTSTLTIPVTGPVDEASLPGTLLITRASDGQPLAAEVTYNAETGQILATPRNDSADNTLQPGERYTFGLRGYAGGARGAADEQVVADSAFYLVRQEVPLTEHLSVIPGETRAEREATAEQLERVREGYASLYDALASRGIPREELAVAASFTTSGRPSLWFDPNQSKIPVPNNLLLDRSTGRVNLPIGPEESDEAKHVKKTLNTYDGFSISGALTVEATAEVDPATVADPANIRVFRADSRSDGGWIEETDLERGVLDDGHTIWVRPRLALREGTEHVVLLSRGITTRDGQAVEAQPVGALLRAAGPLLDAEGRSTVSSVPDGSAASLEPARQDVRALIRHLEVKEGLDRATLAAAVPFRTASAMRWLMEWRAKVYTEGVPTTLANVEAKSPSDRGLGLLLPRVRTIVTGQITILDHLDPLTREFYEDGHAEQRLAEFALTIPRSAEPGKPVPVVLFGHGLETSRELVYLIANILADNGYAAISVDLPYHGERSICLADLDCKDNATCDPEGRCVLSDGSRGEIRSVSSPWPDGPNYPITSGVPFLDLENIVGARDHFIQAIMDMSQLLRVIRGADWGKATGGYVLDGSDVVYLGMSLGGILGAILTTVEPTLNTYVLNVPGGSFVDIVESSGAFQTLYAQTLERRGVTPGTDRYFEFTNTLRWLVDPVDPLIVSHPAVREPVTYTDPVTGEEKVAPIKRVMIQMAKGDSVVPNISTRLLSEAMGVPYREYTPTVSNHAFFFDPTSFEGRRAREDMIEHFGQR